MSLCSTESCAVCFQGFRSLANVLVITFACLGYFNAFLGIVMTACYGLYVACTMMGNDMSKNDSQSFLQFGNVMRHCMSQRDFVFGEFWESSDDFLHIESY